MITARQVRRFLLALAGLLLTSAPAQACPVCIELPPRTLADRVLAADSVVLGRPDPADPFSYTPAVLLAGEAVETAVPFLVDSTTRRRLAAAPSHGVLLLYEDGDWSLGGYADRAFRRVVEDILAARDGWALDASGEARFRYFEALLDRPHERLRALALHEIGQARYGLIRDMARPVPPEDIVASLGTISGQPYADVLIMMLADSPREEDAERIRDAVDRGATLAATSNLAAWATALVEIDGEAGLERLSGHYLGAQARDEVELRLLLTALGVHGKEGDPALRPAITQLMRSLVAKRPTLSGEVAMHLASWGDWSQAERFRAMLAAPEALAPSTALALSMYVARAEIAGR